MYRVYRPLARQERISNKCPVNTNLARPYS